MVFNHKSFPEDNLPTVRVQVNRKPPLPDFAEVP